MREPKRLAHRQAERNKARAMKQWGWDDDELEEPLLAADESGEPELDQSLLASPSHRLQL